MKSTLIKIQEGNRVKEKDGKEREGIIRSITLVPNGTNNPELIASLVVEFDNKQFISCTSDKFIPIDTEEYEEHYPSVHLISFTK